MPPTSSIKDKSAAACQNAGKISKVSVEMITMIESLQMGFCTRWTGKEL